MAIVEGEVRELLDQTIDLKNLYRKNTEKYEELIEVYNKYLAKLEEVDRENDALDRRLTAIESNDRTLSSKDNTSRASAHELLEPLNFRVKVDKNRGEVYVR